MCNRFTLSAPADVVAELFGVGPDFPPVGPASRPVGIAPRYNIAPTQPAPVVLWDGELNRRRFDLLRWGLIPSWADDPSIGNRMINARAETVAIKPAFRAAFRHRRCLVLADGFYEWKKLPRRRQPFYIRMREAAPFAFAGLWEHWEGADGTTINSCTILTTGPNDVVRPVHDRMPVIVHRQEYGRWLAPEVRGADSFSVVLRPYPSEEMRAYPISTRVNDPANDGPADQRP